MKLYSLSVERYFKAIGGKSVYKVLWFEKTVGGSLLSVVVMNIETRKKMRFSGECDCIEVYDFQL